MKEDDKFIEKKNDLQWQLWCFGRLGFKIFSPNLERMGRFLAVWTCREISHWGWLQEPFLSVFGLDSSPLLPTPLVCFLSQAGLWGCPRLHMGSFFFFLAALGLCCCTPAFSSCGEQGHSLLRCTGFSLRWLLLLRSTGSRSAGFSSCGAWA